VAETKLDETVTAGAKISDSSRSAMLAGQIIDAQSRLNLTSLAQAGQPVQAQVVAFRKLLGLIDLPESLAESVAARVARSQPRMVDGKPVAAVELPLIRLSDLMAMPGFDAAAIERLAPFAIVLPIPTLVNVNTAPAEVIAAMVEGLDLAGARRFVAKRERTFFRSLAEASALLEGQPVLPQGAMSVGSGYFIVRGVVRFDRVEATTETLLARNNDRVEIVWQQRY
jgi:general secretion pathway protein K